MTRTPLAASIASIVIASMLTPPAACRAQELGGGSTEAAANRELARRMQREVRAHEEVEAGQTALRKKDYEEAFRQFQNACKDVPRGAPAVAGMRRAAVDGLTTAGIKLAEQRVTEGYYVSATEILKKVLEENPDSRQVLDLLSNIEAPDYFNKQMTPQHRENVEEVKKAFVAAQGYRDLARLGLAERKYEEILNRDPYNVAAHKGREEVALQKNRAAEAGYDSARSMAMWEVTREWTRPIRRFDRGPRSVPFDSKTPPQNTFKITRKLNSIIFPTINFQDSTIREAITHLVNKSKDLDPDKEGVNIVLKLPDEGGAVPAVVPAPPPEPLGIPGLPGVPGVPGAPVPGGGAPILSGGAGTRITLKLNNVPLIEVIRYITNLANLKPKIEPYAVAIYPLGVVTDDLIIKRWKVQGGMFRAAPPVGGGGGVGGGGAAGGGGGFGAPAGGAGGTELAGTTAAKDFLAAKGITFGPGAFAMFSPASSTLVVKNTADQLEIVETIIESEDPGGLAKQVEIQAKFVEISQNNLKELSFDWMLGPSHIRGTNGIFGTGGTSGTSPAVNPADFPGGAQNPLDTPLTASNRSGRIALSASAIDALLFGVPGASNLAPGIFSIVGRDTDPTFQFVARGLDQKKGVDLLSAPRVTTASGKRAVIEIIREFRYPTEFSAPQIPQNNQQVVQGGVLGGVGAQAFPPPIAPTTPTAFEKKDVGVTLEVEPNIGADNYTIEMQLLPQVVEFEGFINYGSPIKTVSSNPITGIPTTNILSENIINQPIFSTRKVNTNVTVSDGATVILGGLVREDVQKVEDKTPILGDIPIFGRLFRSNVDQHVKRNLVIFVTARLVNPEGAPISSDEEKEESVEVLPLPDIAPPGLPALPDFSGGKTVRPLEDSMPQPPARRGDRAGGLNPPARRTER